MQKIYNTIKRILLKQSYVVNFYNDLWAHLQSD